MRPMGMKMAPPEDPFMVLEYLSLIFIILLALPNLAICDNRHTAHENRENQNQDQRS